MDVARLHRLDSSGSQSADTQMANSSGLYLTTSVTNLTLQNHRAAANDFPFQDRAVRGSQSQRIYRVPSRSTNIRRFPDTVMASCVRCAITMLNWLWLITERHLAIKKTQPAIRPQKSRPQIRTKQPSASTFPCSPNTRAIIQPGTLNRMRNLISKAMRSIASRTSLIELTSTSQWADSEIVGQRQSA